jgi:ribulose-5-phosphate 4-epimerase/fuculose-1-phosphate aldolase
VHPFAAVVGTIVELAAPIVSDRGLNTSGQEVKKVVRLLTTVEEFAHVQVEILLATLLRLPQLAIFRDQRIRGINDLFPQGHQWSVMVV